MDASLAKLKENAACSDTLWNIYLPLSAWINSVYFLELLEGTMIELLVLH